MQNELEKLLELPAIKINFKDDQVKFMLENIGDPNPQLRDDIIYTLFARGFSEDLFSDSQKKLIIDFYIKDRGLFKGIDGAKSDKIFVRSFSALLGTILLDSDSQNPIFTDNQRLIIFQWSFEYVTRETDFRGFIPAKGWAHGIAHGSDLLGAALGHKNFKSIGIKNIFNPIEAIISKLKKPFCDEEETRIAYAYLCAIRAGTISEEMFIKFIDMFDDKLWKQYESLVDSLESYYQLVTWFRTMQNWYFFLVDYPKIKKNVELKILDYYKKMGY